MLRKLFVVTLILASLAGAESGYVTMTCLSDSAGREVRLYGPDTIVVYQDVICVIYRAGGFLVSFKNGDTLSLSRPPFLKVDVTLRGDETPPKVEKAKPEVTKTDERDKRNKK